MVLKSSKIGVGNFTSSAPNATLHVTPQSSTDNILQLSSSTGQQMITVMPNGKINIYTESAQVGSIEPTPTGLKLSTNTLEITGNLKVDGIINGTLAA